MRRGPCEATYFRSNKDWYYSDEHGEYAIKDDAPELAKISLQAYRMGAPEKTWTDIYETLTDLEASLIKEKLSYYGIDTQSLDEKMLYLIKVVREQCFFIYDQEMESNYHKCVKIFVRMPRKFVVRFRLAEFNNECIFGQPVIEWNCDNGDITISETFSEISEEEDEFFSKAYFDFAIDEKKGKVYIDYYFGKRYARGMCFSYEYNEEDDDDYEKAWIFDDTVLWVS